MMEGNEAFIFAGLIVATLIGSVFVAFVFSILSDFSFGERAQRTFMWLLVTFLTIGGLATWGYYTVATSQVTVT